MENLQNFPKFSILKYTTLEGVKKSAIAFVNHPEIILNYHADIIPLDADNFLFYGQNLKRHYVTILQITFDAVNVILRFSTLEKEPFMIDDELIKNGCIIIHPNYYFLYSFLNQTIMSENYDTMEIASNKLKVTVKTLLDTFMGYIDFTGRIINNQLVSLTYHTPLEITKDSLNESLPKTEKEMERRLNKKV